MHIDPAERLWLERKSLQIVRETGCGLSEALVEARQEFIRLLELPRAEVIPLRPRVEASRSKPPRAGSN
jgi:hypothetical protein